MKEIVVAERKKKAQEFAENLTRRDIRHIGAGLGSLKRFSDGIERRYRRAISSKEDPNFSADFPTQAHYKAYYFDRIKAMCVLAQGEKVENKYLRALNLEQTTPESALQALRRIVQVYRFKDGDDLFDMCEYALTWLEKNNLVKSDDIERRYRRFEE